MRRSGRRKSSLVGPSAATLSASSSRRHPTPEPGHRRRSVAISTTRTRTISRRNVTAAPVGMALVIAVMIVATALTTDVVVKTTAEAVATHVVATVLAAKKIIPWVIFFVENELILNFRIIFLFLKNEVHKIWETNKST
eukprot:PhM_4_TR4881/c0_g1_i1/m.11024